MYFNDAEFEVYALRPGDILLNEGQSLDLVGRSAIYDGPKDRYCYQNTLVRFRPSDSVNVTYAQLVFQSFLMDGVFASIATRTTSIAHLGVERFAALKIPLPPLPEQRTIAAVLSAWDRAIRQTTDLLDAKRRLKRGLMQQLLTGKRRFPGFSQPLRALRLRDVTEECSERNRHGLGTDVVMAVTKAEGIVPMRERLIGADLERYKQVRKDWFAYNPMRINIGSIARSHSDKTVLVSPDYVVFRCREESADQPGIDPDYLDHVRKSDRWASFVTSSGNGSVRVRIYYDDLGVMPLQLPSMAEQRKIAGLLNAIDSEITLLTQQLAALKTQKKGLMRKLLTGEVRVKVPS
jgi:type I restriction enzyme S subunit